MSSTSMNKVFLMGHLGSAPELKTSKGGKPYARLRLATNRTWKNQEEGKVEKSTDWHSVFVWGRLAEVCADSLKKGALVLIEGSLSEWKVGEKEFKNAIHGHEVRFLNSPKSVGAVASGAQREPVVYSEAENLDIQEDARNH